MISSLGISESMENYLETILDLENTNRVARGKDIADRLGIQRGSVTSALKNLEEKNITLHNVAEYDIKPETLDEFIGLSKEDAMVSFSKMIFDSIKILESNKAEFPDWNIDAFRKDLATCLGLDAG